MIHPFNCFILPQSNCQLNYIDILLDCHKNLRCVQFRGNHSCSKHLLHFIGIVSKTDRTKKSRRKITTSSVSCVMAFEDECFIHFLHSHFDNRSPSGFYSIGCLFTFYVIAFSEFTYHSQWLHDVCAWIT